MQLTLLPSLDLVLAISDPTAEFPFGSYELVGPEDNVEMLQDLLRMDLAAEDADTPRPLVTKIIEDDDGKEVEVVEAPSAAGENHKVFGMLSPRAPVTLPDECKGAAGIPASAKTFCFSYPAMGIEETLGKINLTDEPWAYFLLVGGFCYFDEAGKMCACAALTLVPQIWTLNFDGPYQPTAAALAQLRMHYRMCDVTLDALEEAGFEAFGWAHAQGDASERGVQLTEDTPYPHGGFLYEMVGNEKNFFALVPHTPEQLADFAMQSDDLPGPETFKYGALERWYRKYQRDRIKSRREIEEMTKLTRAATGLSEEEASVARHRRILRWLVIEVKRLLPITSIVVFIPFLLWIAYVNRPLFEFLATFLYYFCFTFTSWVPYRDTAALSILAQSPSRRRKMHALLVFIPFFCAGLTLVSSLSGADGNSEQRENADTATEAIGQFIVYLLIPLLLYSLRAAAAKDMLTGKHGANANRNQLLSAQAAAAVFDAADTTGEENVAKLPAAAPEAASFRSEKKKVGHKVGEILSHSGLPLDNIFMRGKSNKVAPAGAPAASGEGAHMGAVQAELSMAMEAPEVKKKMKRAATSKVPDSRDKHLLSGKSDKALLPGGKQRRAAQKLQARIRGRIARRKYIVEIQRRRQDLLTFRWPIFIWALFDIVGSLTMRTMNERGMISEGLHILVVMPWTAVPSFIMVFLDLLKEGTERQVRFSLSHCIFVIAVLYRLSFRAAIVDNYFLQQINSGLDRVVTTYDAAAAYDLQSYAPTFCMVAHFAIFILVTALGKLALQLVATKNACAHLLYPFQFFDFIFLYVFFSLRDCGKELNSTWLVQQVLLQANILLRNSGTTDAILVRQLPRLIPNWIHNTDKMAAYNPDDDPLFHLQFLARITVQYDLADLTALLAVPSVVTFFIHRDGWFTLQGSEIIVRHCDIWRMWQRFLFLLVIKPFMGLLARHVLQRRMRKTLLGKKTIHGQSMIAAKLKVDAALNVGKRDGGSGGAANIHERFNLTEEQLKAVQDDLTLSGLNFALLYRKLLRKWRFYVCVSLLQCFASFQVHMTAPLVSATGSTLQDHMTGSHDAHTAKLVVLPQRSAWAYVPPPISLHKDPLLAAAFNLSLSAVNPASCPTQGHTGWDDYPGLIAKAAREVPAEYVT